MLMNNETKSQYDRDGYCCVRSLLAESEVFGLKEYVKVYVKKFAPRLEGRNINWLNKEKGLVNSIHKTDLDPESPITQLLHSDKLIDRASEFFGEKALPRVGEIFFKPAQQGMRSPMHQDNYYWCLKPANALTVWLSLTGADHENGGVGYYVGSHKLGILDHVDSFAPGSSQMVKPDLLPEKSQMVIPSLNPGDALFHHSLTIHGSEANTSMRDRVGVTLQYQAKSCEIDLEQQEIYLSSLKNQVALREDGVRS
jgi:phytanoyl-CoA hydroxylase